MKKLLLVISILFSFNVNSQKLHFKYEKDSLELVKSISSVAKKLLEVYENKDKVDYLDNFFRIQIAANEYENAIISLDSLRSLYKDEYGSFINVIGIQYESYAKTKIKQKNSTSSFKEIFIKVFDNIYSKIDKADVDYVKGYYDHDISSIKKKLIDINNEFKNKDSITIDEARLLCRRYASYKSYKLITPLALPILKANEEKKYIIQDSIIIKTKRGAELSAVIVRPRDIETPIPAIFRFNIYANNKRDISRAKLSASYNYAGVVVNTRGKKYSKSEINPFEYDASDAFEIIDWISKQPWCNGKIGMYGGSYLGFSQWAATKKMHPALKTIVPQVSVGTGIDYPMYNNVFMSYMLRWIHYVENNKFTDSDEFNNIKKWDSIYYNWYRTGKSFRALDSIDGRPNKTFQKWLDHSSYDKFWKEMTPNGDDFSKINIPILSITGYYDVDQRGAMYYLEQHYKYNKNPEHYLLIGPYDHGGAQGYPKSILKDYKIDSVANIKIMDITFKWFDHILKDSIKKPDIIKNKINYQVMGSNKWKHVSSINKMNNDTLKFFLDNTIVSNYNKLTQLKPRKIEFIRQELDFLDRTDSLLYSKISDKIIDSVFQKQNGIAFISKPFNKPFEINGSFTGKINLEINKKDLDIEVRLYEVDSEGKFFSLSSYLGRASYAKDKSNRKLLRPNKKEFVPIKNAFFTSKLISPGSKLLVILSINKNPNWQINYGTGKDVSNETINDGKIPLKVKWFNDSFINIPVKINK